MLAESQPPPFAPLAQPCLPHSPSLLSHPSTSPIIPLLNARQVFQGLRKLVASSSSSTARSASHASIPAALKMERPINVLGTPLAKCGSDPITGFYRDGYCNTSPADGGSHTVAAIVSDSWLQFSASRGNDLRPILKGGCRWCLCASRWKESLDAWKRGEIEESVVPKVVLAATHEAALRKIKLDDLRAFAIDPNDRAATSSSGTHGEL